MSSNVTAKIDNIKLGPPGIESELHFVVQYNSDQPRNEEEDKKALLDRTLRPFQITLFFQKDYLFTNSINASRADESGNSFLQFASGMDVLLLESAGIAYRIVPNSNKQASCAKAEVVAESRQAAVEAFLNGINPVLDHLCFLSNTPLFYNQVLIYDKKNEVRVVNYTSPYKDFTLNAGFGLFQLDLIEVYSLYREAKNSVSPFYKTLCYFKIMEGILKSIRPKVRNKAKDLGITLPKIKEVVPHDEELSMFNSSYVGKSIGELYHKEFEGDFRNAIAHFELDDKAPINFSNYSERAQFSNKIHLLEVCTRTLISNLEQECLLVNKS
ncbi:MAG: methylamine utilization protein MauJ [Bdellovibrionota bacterium]